MQHNNLTMKLITKLQKGNIIHLVDGRKAKVLQTYFKSPLNKVMAKVIDKDYSKANYHADMFSLEQITKVTS